MCILNLPNLSYPKKILYNTFHHGTVTKKILVTRAVHQRTSDSQLFVSKMPLSHDHRWLAPNLLHLPGDESIVYIIYYIMLSSARPFLDSACRLLYKYTSFLDDAAVQLLLLSLLHETISRRRCHSLGPASKTITVSFHFKI